MASSVLAWADDAIVSSPNGKLQVTISDAGGRLYYSVALDGQQVLQPSALGLKTSLGDLSKDLSILNGQSSTVNGQRSTVNGQYQMRGTKASSATYKANTLTLDVQNKDGRKFSVLFQVSDNDIAFRYLIPRQTVDKKNAMEKRIVIILFIVSTYKRRQGDSETRSYKTLLMMLEGETKQSSWTP